MLQRALSVLVLVIASVSPALAELTTADICDVWAANAVMGGANAYMDRPRVLIPLGREGLIEAIEHKLMYGAQGIYVWAEDYAEDPAFITESVFFGYDMVMAAKAAGKEADLPNSNEQAHGYFFNVCMQAKNK